MNRLTKEWVHKAEMDWLSASALNDKPEAQAKEYYI